jgi:hypothetical protein
MLLHAFPSMSVSSLGEFRENCVYRHGGFNCFMKYLHRKLLTTNFSFMILKVLKNVHLLDLYIKTIIFLFYNYTHVFNSSQNDWRFWYKSVISSVEVYDKHIITCHFSYHTLYQHSFIYHPLSLTALGMIKGMI